MLYCMGMLRDTSQTCFVLCPPVVLLILALLYICEYMLHQRWKQGRRR
jgi:hypothetical protein